MKKVFSILLTVLMMFGIAGCGVKDTEYEFLYSHNRHNDYWHAYAQLLTPDTLICQANR